MIKSLNLSPVCIALLVFLASGSLAEVLPMINYQGRLTNSDSGPAADSTYTITFRTYCDSAIGASVQWTEQDTVTTAVGRQ